MLYLLFEFQKLLPRVLEGGEQNATVEVGLARVEDHGDLFHEPHEYVDDNFEVLEPRTLGTLLQRFCLQGFLACMEGLEEQSGVADHILPLPACGLLVMAKEKGHLPGGKGCL